MEADGRLLVHASAATGLHGADTVATGRSSIVTYELRLDGFVYLTCGGDTHVGYDTHVGDGQGCDQDQDHDQATRISTVSFTTVPVKWGSGDLIVNADAASSAQDMVAVAVLDADTRTALPGYGAADSLVFVGTNQTMCEWSWSGGHRTMGALAGKAVRFEVELAGGARLYSLRGIFAVIV